MEWKMDIWLNSELDRGSLGPLNQFHVLREENVKFSEGFVEIREGEKTVLVPWHKIDHIEII